MYAKLIYMLHGICKDFVNVKLSVHFSYHILLFETLEHVRHNIQHTTQSVITNQLTIMCTVVAHCTYDHNFPFRLHNIATSLADQSSSAGNPILAACHHLSVEDKEVHADTCKANEMFV